MVRVGGACWRPGVGVNVVNVPFVVSVEGLRGLPGARSAGVLAAYACQPHQDLSGSVRGPAAECVERFGAARRLEGWSVWLQVFEAARLARYWDGHPFDADPAAGVDCGGYWNAVEAADPALYERLVGQLNRVQARTPRDVDAVELTDEFVAAECALASGLTRRGADGRALAARVLVIDGGFPRVTALLRAGFLDWSKLNQLLPQLLALGPVLGPAVERALIPDTDLAVAESAPGPDGAGEVEPQLEVLADPARPGAALPAVTRMSIGAMLAAITAHATALDPDGAAERARDARARRSVWTVRTPTGWPGWRPVRGTRTSPRSGTP